MTPLDRLKIMKARKFDHMTDEHFQDFSHRRPQPLPTISGGILSRTERILFAQLEASRLPNGRNISKPHKTQNITSGNYQMGVRQLHTTPEISEHY